MSHRLSLLCVGLFLGGCFTAKPCHGLNIPPKPQSYVTDTASLLNTQQKQLLERSLTAIDRQTGKQIVVVTFPSLEGENVEDFSIRLAEAWKVGHKEQDNGVLFLVFLKERRVRIEVGYGLEALLPDALAGQIIQQGVLPFFKQEQYGNGIVAGVNAVAQAILPQDAQEFRARHPHSRARSLTAQEKEALRKKLRLALILIVIAALGFFISDLFRYQQYLTDHRIFTSNYSFWEWFFRFSLLLFVISMLFRMLFYMLLFSRGGMMGSRSGMGGGYSGGGGSFGGGGASGSW